MEISARQYKIIQILRENVVPVSGELLCHRLGVSARTLRYEISSLNSLAGCRFIRSGSQGYYINAELDSSDIFDSIQIVDFENGINWMCIKILDKGELSVYDLEEYFSKSTSAILNALPGIEKLMRRFDLKLVKKGQRLRVEGRESDQRRLIMHSFFFNGGVDDSFEEDTDRYFHLLVPDVIHDLVDEVLEQQNIQIDDIYRRNVVLIIAVTLERIRQRHPIEMTPVFPEGSLETEKRFIDEVLEKAGKLAAIEISDDERRFLYQSVLALIRMDERRAGGSYIGGRGEEEFRKVLTEILNDTFAHFHIQCEYQGIIDSFVLHVFYLIVRYRTNSFFRNDITSSLRHSHPFVYEVSVYLASRLEEEFQIRVPHEEIGLLAIYLGPVMTQGQEDASSHVILVCPDYNGVREMIRQKLLLFFGAQINIVREVASYYQIGPEEEYDFVISVLGKQKTLKDVVYISPLMGQREFEKIEARLPAIAKRKEIEDIDQCFRRYLTKEHFFYGSSFETGLQVLEFLDEGLRRENIVPEDYLADVLRREKLSSTAFFNQVAVPHALEVKAKATCLVYYCSEKPIDWFGTPVHLVLLIANRGYDREFSRLFEILYEIIVNGELLYRIQKCRTYDQLMDFLLSLV